MYFHQPDIDPVLLHLWGPLQIRWYSLLYVGGFLVGRELLKKLAREDRFLFSPNDMEQFVMWLLIAAVIGARVVYCVVYDPTNLMRDPLFLFQTYKGGLSFHGGILGTVVGAIIFARKKKIPFWNIADAMALSTPTGLAMGRLGNFINGELYGRVTTVPWGVIFKDGGPDPRHPSQLYELFMEGILLFAVLWLLKNRLKKDGQIGVIFLMGYTLSRFIVEFFREPDAHIGYLTLGLSMGQWLSIAMFIVNLIVAYFIFRKKPEPALAQTHSKKKKI